ncbi:uncharacterized protein TNCT_231931 [Trichonephila clavata]|uniref:MADF domain-containing protein n=1 Tax=Trichonephila clavata TaxID=2740835 RepID=A0A8X6H3L5_TRICU|nr:uncharacterized protein TNCT_231931 [Trichonephila clavata]
MSANIFWTPEQDEILIDFVRNHDVLYNIRHPDYRKVQAKQHLWESIGTTLEKSGSDSCKRWGYVRDYYIRRRGKPGSGSSGFAAKKRSELLSFLDSFAASQKPTTTNVGSSHGLSYATQLSPTEQNIDTGPEIITPDILEHDSNDEFGTMEKFEIKRRKFSTGNGSELSMCVWPGASTFASRKMLCSMQAHIVIFSVVSGAVEIGQKKPEITA